MRLAPLALLMLLWAAAAEAAYQMTPFTIGWAFPSAATYAAGIADNGIGLSAYNTSAGLTITLPANSATLPPGWHLCAANDNGKVATIEVNAANGGKILLPAAGAVTSMTLAGGNYETVCLQADSSGGNFRLLWLTPKSAAALGVASYVTGPGSSTDGWVATWSGTSGTVLATGHPVANSGANMVLETDSGGKIDVSTMPATVVIGPASTPAAGLVPQWNGGSDTLTSGLPVANSGANSLMETDSSGHLATSILDVAASGSGGKIVCNNGGSLYLGSATSC
jgi:hypothetical protein